MDVHLLMYGVQVSVSVVFTSIHQDVCTWYKLFLDKCYCVCICL